MKKKIFIAIQYLEIGGVERSLIGLLGVIDYTRYDVDLFIYRHTGELMSFIPKQVNLLKEIPVYTTLTRPIIEIIKEGYFRIAAARLWAKHKASLFGKQHTDQENYAIFQYVADATTNALPTINNIEYDLAISFLTPHNIVKEKVKAKKKIAWIHTDYSAIAIDIRQELRIWKSYDYIAAISENTRLGFLAKFPSLNTKIVLIENILSADAVKKQALLENVQLKGKIKLLTVGRFCYPKALDNAVRICAKLVQMGLPVKWYAIGYGDEQTIQRTVEACKMHEHFVILGKKTNPYPYIAACDIYVQPSRYEGKAVTVREAQILGKPVAITAFPTSASQLKDGIDGVIIPMDIDGAALGLKKFIENKEQQDYLQKNMAVTDYSNQSEVQVIYNLI